MKEAGAANSTLWEGGVRTVGASGACLRAGALSTMAAAALSPWACSSPGAWLASSFRRGCSGLVVSVVIAGTEAV